jgi:cytochrome P450
VTGVPLFEHRDWSTNFDHADPVYNANAPIIWSALRPHCPVARTEAYGGTWLPLTHQAVQEIAYDTEHFSSLGVVVSNQVPDWENAPLGGAPPITADPPAHHDARRLLLPAFAPHAIKPWEPEIRNLCRTLLDGIQDRMGSGREFDAALEYAQHIPVHVIVRMLGMPSADADLFREFVHLVLEAVDVTVEERVASFERVTSYIKSAVDDHRAKPRQDLIGYLVNARNDDGQALSDEHIVGTVILLLVAGIDTTWSAIGSALEYLATHPEDCQRLVANPSLMPSAVEEFLRAFAPVTMARIVTKDVEVEGVTMRRGDWTLLPFPAANRDPLVFERPDEVLLDREVNRHAAFGLGIHRCLGSNLARLELGVAIEEFLARFGSEFTSPGATRYSVGQVRGPRELPMRLLLK